MDCARCEHLESELGRLGRTHAEKAGTLLESGDGVRGGKHRSLRIAESDSRLNLEIARAELNQHKRNHPKEN
jgi:hypothetical protein